MNSYTSNVDTKNHCSERFRILIIIAKLHGTKPGTKLSIKQDQNCTIAGCVNLHSLNPL